MKTIEEQYVEVRARYIQILESRDIALGVLRRANLRTVCTSDAFAAATWRRLFSPALYEAQFEKRLDEVREELRSADAREQSALPFISLERRNWPVITGRMLLEYRPQVSFESLLKVHEIWARQQEFMFSPKVFWKVIFPLFALVTGSQAHILGALNIPDSVLENGFFKLAITFVLGYSMIYFLAHVVLVVRARRDDEAMRLALTAAEVLQEEKNKSTVSFE